MPPPQEPLQDGYWINFLAIVAVLALVAAALYFC